MLRTVAAWKHDHDEIDWNHELLDQLDWHWKDHLRPRLDNLTDHEYLWEPVAGCWSLRPRDEAVSPMAAGAGDVVADFEYPEPQPAPFTTIAWRMGHISIGVLGTRAANHFGEPGSVEYESPSGRSPPPVGSPCSTITTKRGSTACARSATMVWTARAARPRARWPTTRWRRWCSTSRVR